MDQIHGMTTRPALANDADNKRTWQSSEFYTEKNFMYEYRRHLIAMQHIAECAKIFVNENWKLVDDWSELNVTVKDNKPSTTEYYNHVPQAPVAEGKTRSKVLERILDSRINKHNPINSISNVVLDTTDGDFSLIINNNHHLWIDDESVIVIANFIERKIKQT